MRIPKSRSAHLKLCNIAILCTKTGAISTVQGSRKGFELRQFVCFVQVGRVGFEPTRGVTSADFKSAASAVPPPSRPGDSRNRGLAESNGPLDRHCFTLVDIGCGPSWAYSSVPAGAVRRFRPCCGPSGGADACGPAPPGSPAPAGTAHAPSARSRHSSSSSCRWKGCSRPSRPRSARAGVGPSRHYRPAGVDMQVHACI